MMREGDTKSTWWTWLNFLPLECNVSQEKEVSVLKRRWLNVKRFIIIEEKENYKTDLSVNNLGDNVKQKSAGLKSMHVQLIIQEWLTLL